MDGYWDPLEETDISVEQLWEQLDETTAAYTGLPAGTIFGAGILMYTVWLLVRPVFNHPCFKDPTKKDKEAAAAEKGAEKAEPQQPAAEQAQVNKASEEQSSLPSVADEPGTSPQATPQPVLQRQLPAPVIETPKTYKAVLTPLVSAPWQYGPLTKAGELTETQVVYLSITEEELKGFNGSAENTPLYVALSGVIYDVAKSRHLYGPGKPYAIFAGKEVSKALAKWSLASQHLTGDIGDLTSSEKRRLDHWKKMFGKKYPEIGSIKRTL